MAPTAATTNVPSEPLGRLFLRFLKFGLLAWGGPVAQIAMIRQEIVEEERWVSPEHFNRVLAVYQALPGPEAHELCVYFGMLAGGRVGGLLAGLGFMLPGFLLMLALSALYVEGLAPQWRLIFIGVQPAVIALIVRAVHRIGVHAITNRWLLAIAVVAGVAQLFGLPFGVVLPLGGLAYVLASRKRHLPAIVVLLVIAAAIPMFSEGKPAWTLSADSLNDQSQGEQPAFRDRPRPSSTRPSLLRLFISGLRAGLLTFGGAYTAIPFLQQDAVVRWKWMWNTEFLDGLALSGILPAPFIIFSTFVGYIGGGPVGAIVLTLGVFLPAFTFTLAGHEYFERLIANPTIRTFLDGVTAAVVGLIAATTLILFPAGVRNALGLAIFAVALLALYLFKAKGSVAVIMLASGILGALFAR